jgi:hypothetical protein
MQPRTDPKRKEGITDHQVDRIPDRDRGRVLPILLKEAVVFQVVLKLLELFWLALVKPFFRLGLLVGVDLGDEGRRLEGLRLRWKVPEAALDVVPLRARPFHVLVHEVVVRHGRSRRREMEEMGESRGERSEGTRRRKEHVLTCGPGTQTTLVASWISD